MSRHKRSFYAWLYKLALRKYRQSWNQPDFQLPKTRLTNHAILRYLERIENYDIEGLHDKLITPALVSMSNELGGNCKLVVDNVAFTIKDGNIVSIGRPHKLQPTQKTLDGEVRRWSF